MLRTRCGTGAVSLWRAGLRGGSRTSGSVDDAGQRNTRFPRPMLCTCRSRVGIRPEALTTQPRRVGVQVVEVIRYPRHTTSRVDHHLKITRSVKGRQRIDRPDPPRPTARPCSWSVTVAAG